MIERLLLVVFLTLVSAIASGADTYRWEDKDGNVHYSDELPPVGARNIRRAQLNTDASAESLPYRLQVAVSRYPVTLYVSTDCGEPCDLARRLLIQRGVPHKLLDASGYEVQQALMALIQGELEVPIIEIGKTVLKGFEAGQWNGELDRAGYPKDALIKVKPSVPRTAEKAATQEGKSDASAETDSAETDTAESDAAGEDAGADSTSELDNGDAEPFEVEQQQ